MVFRSRERGGGRGQEVGAEAGVSVGMRDKGQDQVESDLKLENVLTDLWEPRSGHRVLAPICDTRNVAVTVTRGVAD